MIRLRWKEKWIDFESVEWSGTENQCSRQVTFSIPSNPYDKSFEKLDIKLGDLIYLYECYTINSNSICIIVDSKEYHIM